MKAAYVPAAVLTVAGLTVFGLSGCPNQDEPVNLPTAVTRTATPTPAPLPKKAVRTPSAKPGVPVKTPQRDTCEVLRVVDGDTLDAMCARGKIRVRVIGIDTPEVYGKKECYGKQASDAARELLGPEPGTGATQTVLLTSDPTQADQDRYDRFLRYVDVTSPDNPSFIGGTWDLGEYLIKGGFAEEYTYDNLYERRARYKKAEALAKADSAGMWGGC